MTQSNKDAGWQDLPREIKNHVCHFLDSRSQLFLSLTNKTESARDKVLHENQMKMLLSNNSGIKKKDEWTIKKYVTFIIAHFMYLTSREIEKSERFEALLISLVERLDPQIFSDPIKIKSLSNYNYNENYFIFTYRGLTLDQLKKVATTLQQYFLGQIRVCQMGPKADYSIYIPREMFLTQILPCLVNVNPLPEKPKEFKAPIVGDWKYMDKHPLRSQDFVPLSENERAEFLNMLGSNEDEFAEFMELAGDDSSDGEELLSGLKTALEDEEEGCNDEADREAGPSVSRFCR